jgi:mono/diheme cytochrome c family protein
VSLVACIAAQLPGCAARTNAPEASLGTSRAVLGQEWFEVYCAQCHGEDARGSGSLADSLRPPPADLTNIAARKGGIFDADAVAGYIDGRLRVGAHGTTDMPIWGAGVPDRFGRPGREEPLLSADAVALIVEYLRSIQTERTA